MKKTLTKILLALGAAALLCSSASAFSFDDIQLWAGSGSNRAAMVIEWNSPEVFNNTSVKAPSTTKCLAFGYRFDGDETGEDMFNAILASNCGLYTVTSGTTAYGKAVFGIGYDLDKDGDYGLTNGSTVYTLSDFKDGVLSGSYDDPDYLNATDSGDVYWGGWYGPNWELWHQKDLSATAPNRGSGSYWTTSDGWSGYDGGWEFSQVGMSGMTLTDGSWMGWSVAAGGLEFGSDSDGTTAWEYHKHAPDVSTISTVPEPGALAGLVTGLASLGGLVLRKRK